MTTKRVTLPSDFCGACVVRREVTEWLVLGRWRLWTTENVSPTPVSELLAEKNLCPPHQHDWVATSYVENPETADAASVLSLGYLNQPRVVSFLRELIDYTDAASTQRWRELAWKLEYASTFDAALRYCRFPEAGFTNRPQFLAWWNESSFPLFHRLNQMNEAD